MMKQRNILLSLLLILVLGACKSEKTAEEIQTEMSSGVVLVAHRYYYSFLADGYGTYYFSGITDGQFDGLYSASDVEPAEDYATGFFVGKEGQVLTNKHFLRPQVSEREVEKAFLYYFARVLDVKIRNLKLHSEVYVFYNGTDGFYSSSPQRAYIVSSATDGGADLALIQLADKETPNSRHVFSFDGSKSPWWSLREKWWPSNKKPKVQDPLYMLGYNGWKLANSDVGIQPEINQGSLSREESGCQIQYSLSVMPASGGSPVFNSNGDLVAVNAIGMRDNGYYNYGIPLECIKRFLESAPQQASSHSSEGYSGGGSPSYSGRTADGDSDRARSLLEDYYRAMVEQDYVKAASFYAPEIERFHTRRGITPADVVQEMRNYNKRFRMDEISLSEWTPLSGGRYRYVYLLETVVLSSGNAQYYQIEGEVRFDGDKMVELNDYKQTML